MPTDTEVEEKMRKLEAEVRASRAASAPPPGQAALPREPAPIAKTSQRDSPAPPAAAAKLGFFGRRWARASWKNKLIVIGGAILAGAITLWVAGKVLKLALYVGVVAVVAYGVWWVLRKKKP